jgi:hypothetical protein
MKTGTIGAIAISLAAAAFSRANVIYSDIDTSGFNPYSGWSLMGTDYNNGNGMIIAASFDTGSYAGALGSISLAVDWWGASGTGAGTNDFGVSLVADASNLPDTTQTLYNWDLPNVPGIFATWSAEVLTPSTTLNLTANTQYWIVVTPGAADTFGSWVTSNDTTSQGLDAFETVGGSFWNSTLTPNLAFEVDGTATPEPATLITLGLGAAAIAVRRRRQSKK